MLEAALERQVAGKRGVRKVLSRFLVEAALDEADRILAGKKST